MIGRSIWGQAKKEFGKVNDEKVKKEMVTEFVDFYGKNIINESTLIRGVKEFLNWCKDQSYPWLFVRISKNVYQMIF